MEENQSSKEADIGFRLLRDHYKWRLKISHNLQQILTPTILKGKIVLI